MNYTLRISLVLLLVSTLSLNSLFSQKKAATKKETRLEKLCEKCCECNTLRPDSKAYKHLGCKWIALACKELERSGTGPVVVGGSKNEYGESCTCGQNIDFSVTDINYPVIEVKGLKRPAKVQTLVEVYDKKSKKIFSSKGKTFKVILQQKKQARVLKKVKSFKLGIQQNAIIIAPVKLNPKTKLGRATIKITVFTINPKTKKRIILTKQKKSIQIVK